MVKYANLKINAEPAYTN